MTFDEFFSDWRALTESREGPVSDYEAYARALPFAKKWGFIPASGDEAKLRAQYEARFERAGRGVSK